MGVDHAPRVFPKGRDADCLDQNVKIKEFIAMAKPTTNKIKLLSTAGTGFFYVTKKNARTMTEKLVVKKYDPVARKHVEFKEGKIK